MQNVLKVEEEEQEHGKHRFFSDTGSNYSIMYYFITLEWCLKFLVFIDMKDEDKQVWAWWWQLLSPYIFPCLIVPPL